jgi:NADPH:quinone reductase-like Zn-dependent oxidoreductase
MRAFVLTDFRTTPELVDLELPEPAEGEVRVRVHAAAVNGFDTAVANNYLEGMMEHRFPVVLGKDFAGVVDAVGPGATGYHLGDRVFGVVTKPFLGDGSFAEYVTVPVSIGITTLPGEIDFADGAGLGLAGTAAVTILDAAHLQPGQTVLVVGATGGVGNQVVQLAAKTGAHVLATASSAEEQSLVTELGADATVDYASGDIAEAVRRAHPEGVDVAIHLAGDPAPLLRAVRSGGRFISTLLGSAAQLPSEDATVIGIYANPDAATLDRVARLHLDGVSRVRVQDTFPLDQAASALDAFGRGTLGKLIITTA